MIKIVNVDIVTEQMKLKNNFLKQGQFDFSPQISREIGVQNEGLNQFFTKLSLKVGKTEKGDFPVDVCVELKAVFTLELSNECTRKHVDRFLRQQGVHILYPYIRTAVSALTSAALMPSITLPVINAFNLFKEDQVWIKENFPEEVNK